MNIKPFAVYFVGFFLVLSGTLFIGWWQVDGPGNEALEKGAIRATALADMSFELTDQKGTTVSPQNLLGRPTLVFFGFTHCPDVCPTTLSDITTWLNALDSEAGNLNTIFITVDPERDTVKTIADYISNFHPAIEGWTGTADQLAKAAMDFQIIYRKIPTEGGDYTMDHSSSVLLYDANGFFKSSIDYHESRETAVSKIRLVLED